MAGGLEVDSGEVGLAAGGELALLLLLLLGGWVVVVGFDAGGGVALLLLADGCVVVVDDGFSEGYVFEAAGDCDILEKVPTCPWSSSDATETKLQAPLAVVFVVASTSQPDVRADEVVVQLDLVPEAESQET